MADDTYAIDVDTGLFAHMDDTYRLGTDQPTDPSNVIDDFEDNDLVEYIATDPVGTWHSKRSNAMGGKYILEGDGASTGYNSWLISDLSLPNLPTRGDVFCFDWEVRNSANDLDNSKFFVLWANQDASSGGIHNHYAVEHEIYSTEVDIEVDVGGNDISLGDKNVPALDNYTRYRSTIDFDSAGDGRIGFKIQNLENGNILTDYYSDTDTRYDSGGIGFYIRHGLRLWVDNIVNLSV